MYTLSLRMIRRTRLTACCCYTILGSLDSLVHYSSLLLALGVEGDEKKEIKASINDWLQRLVDIDPDRSERYLALS
jgi:hypothetical protein